MFGLDDAAIAAMIAAAEEAAAAAAAGAAEGGMAAGAVSGGAGMGTAATGAAMESAAMPAAEAGMESASQMGTFSEFMGDDMGMLMDDPALSPYEMPSQPQPGVQQQALSSPTDASGVPASNNPLGKAPTPDSMQKMPDMLNSMADQMLFGKKAPPPTHARLPEQQRRQYQPTTMRMQKKRRY